MAKFKQALQHDFNRLEALLNICIQYQKLGNPEAEIQGLKLLKQVKRKKSSNDLKNQKLSAVFASNGLRPQALVLHFSASRLANNNIL